MTSVQELARLVNDRITNNLFRPSRRHAISPSVNRIASNVSWRILTKQRSPSATGFEAGVTGFG